jgi:hypothetical protein
MPQWLPGAEVESRGRREMMDPEIEERELRRAKLGRPSKRRGRTTVVPVRRVVVKRSTQRLTTCSSMVAQIVGDGLEGSSKGGKKTWNHTKERGDKGGHQ